ncbi:MAG: hypothetical protein HYS22_09260 [Deltaproteobacteria bacterium]|nr:hypothetical protein [Deltaproteobacteria bacterium]MBI2088842.1 hypothetical protein [Deltaproteobacteria bacterium]
MERKYYLIEVGDGIEPSAQGPFETEDERDAIAKEIRAAMDEDDCLFWADVDERGILTVGSYDAAFFMEEQEGDCS